MQLNDEEQNLKETHEVYLENGKQYRPRVFHFDSENMIKMEVKKKPGVSKSSAIKETDKIFHVKKLNI